jgi:hypothetical protein
MLVFGFAVERGAALHWSMVITRGHAVVGAAVVGIGLLSLVVWLLARGPEPGPEQQIETLIEQSIDDAEEGEVGDLIDRVSAAYQGEGGDRAGLRSYLTGLLFRGGVDVKVLSQQIAVSGEAARVELEVVLVRGGLRGAAEGDVGARTVRVDLAREDDEWMVTGSQVD